MYESVKNWTSKVDIFDKKYIFIPINESDISDNSEYDDDDVIELTSKYNSKSDSDDSENIIDFNDPKLKLLLSNALKVKNSLNEDYFEYDSYVFEELQQLIIREMAFKIINFTMLTLIQDILQEQI
ncbi:hypothetical protein U3516DRAFT_665756 [Neocallimastix sp. 'constans']